MKFVSYSAIMDYIEEHEEVEAMFGYGYDSYEVFKIDGVYYYVNYELETFEIVELIAQIDYNIHVADIGLFDVSGLVDNRVCGEGIIDENGDCHYYYFN